MSSDKLLRILLADDHTMVREGLRSIINGESGMAVVGEAVDGKAVLAQADQLKPDVVVMDISMPEMNGVEATMLLKSLHPEIKVLGLTVHEDRSYLEQLLGAGASGYVLKRAAAKELITALRTVSEGGTYLDPKMAAAVAEGIRMQWQTELEIPEKNLTRRELMVLKLVAHGYTNKEVAARLELSVKTIEAHKAHGMEKLGFQSRADLVRFALEEGWLGDK